MLKIPGDYGTGGGAITRLATALSAITRKPIKIAMIRAGRPKPGLKTQHLEGIKAIAKLCNAKLSGAELGSTEIEFKPGKIEAKKLKIKVKTAGSLGLLFQALKLPSSQASGKISIKIDGGATFGKWSPPLLASKNVLLPLAAEMGYKASIKIKKHGFYPEGGARAEIIVKPWKDQKPLRLAKQGKIEKVKGISLASQHLKKAKVAERQARAASHVIKEKLAVEQKIRYDYCKAICPGSGIVLWLKSSTGVILGSDALGERGKLAEKVGKEAALKLFQDWESGATVDRHLADQLIPFMAFATKSLIKVPTLTDHLKTNQWLCKKFLPIKFKDRGKKPTKVSSIT